MSEAADQVIDLIYGYWRSQILYAGVELGVFDHIARNRSMQAKAVAEEIGADEKLLYRLMRALASLGLLVEDESRGFAISEAGELLRSGYPGSLRDRVLVADGPEHYAIWKHLPSIIRDGKQDGFVREFGARAFEYARTNAHYRRTFDRGMTSHSVLQSSLVLQALRHYDFLRIGTMCDIGGGHGHLICTLLKAYPHLSGLVLDLPEVFQDPSQLWASRFGLEDRCRYVAGDMFNRVPQADAYCLKMILHDWDDQECIKILSNLRIATSPEARVFVMEQVVPGPHEPHISKLFDIHMMCWGTGRERTEAEYARLLEAAGWNYYRTWYPKDQTLGVVEGRLST